MFNNENSLLNQQTYRYLTIKERDQPLQCISQFCTNETSLEFLRYDFRNIFKCSCSRSCFTSDFGIPQEYTIIQRGFIKLLELAYILSSGEDDFKLTKSDPLFKCGNYWFGYHVDRKTLDISYPTIFFRTLLDEELNNVRVLFKSLFEYMSLKDWIVTMDNILEAAYSNESYADTYDDGHRVIFIMEYIEKLAEAIFLIHHLRSVK